MLGNHDQHRIATRVGLAQARVAAMLLLTLRGTPTLYYGDEIGMLQISSGRAGAGSARGTCLDRCRARWRRTPMQWDASAHAGFSQAQPWLPVGETYQHENVEKQRRDNASLYNLYRRLIALRRSRRALVNGS